MAKKPTNKPIINQKSLTPLWIIASFVSLSELATGYAATATEGAVQLTFTIFSCVFPILIGSGFFSILWFKPYAFYPPSEFPEDSVGSYVNAMRGEPSTNLPTVKQDGGDTAKLPPSPPSQELSILPPETVSLISVPKDDALPQKPDDPDELWFEMYTAFVDGKAELGHSLYKKLTQVHSEQKQRFVNDTWYHYLNLVHLGSSNALTELKKLTEVPEASALAFFMIGNAYARSRDFDKARKAYEAVLSLKPLPENAANAAVRVANCFLEEDNKTRAIETLTNSLLQFDSQDERATIYEGLADVYKHTDDHELRALALEKVLELKPNNTSIRFDAAWCYSKHDMHHIALFHYSTVLNLKPNQGGALNNLAVEADHFGLKTSAVKNYKRALELDETLAASNLAHLYLSAGFVDEARLILNGASKVEKPHPNVGAAYVIVNEKVEAEEKKSKELLHKGQAEQRFLKVFAEAYFLPVKNGNSFYGDWLSLDGAKFAIAGTDEDVSAVWTEGKLTKTLTGRWQNMAMKFKLESVNTILANYSSLLSGKQEESGYGHLSADGTRMAWMLIKDGVSSFSILTRPEDQVMPKLTVS